MSVRPWAPRCAGRHAGRRRASAAARTPVRAERNSLSRPHPQRRPRPPNPAAASAGSAYCCSTASAARSASNCATLNRCRGWPTAFWLPSPASSSTTATSFLRRAADTLKVAFGAHDTPCTREVDAQLGVNRLHGVDGFSVGVGIHTGGTARQRAGERLQASRLSAPGMRHSRAGDAPPRSPAGTGALRGRA